MSVIKKYMFLLALAVSSTVLAQKTLTLDQAVALATERNPEIQGARLSVKQQESLRGTALDLPKTSFSLLHGQYNSIHKNDNNFSVSQSIPFPSVFSAQKGLVKARESAARGTESMLRNDLVFRVRNNFNLLLFLKERGELLHEQDSILAEMVRVARVQYRTGEGNQLQVTAAEAQHIEVQNALRRNEIDFGIALNNLTMLSQVEGIEDVSGDFAALLPEIERSGETLSGNPTLQLQQQVVEVTDNERRVESSRAMPEFEIGYFNQSLIGPQTINGVERFFDGNTRFQGIQVGVSIPVFFTPHRSRIRSAAYATQVAEKQLASSRIRISQEYIAAVQSMEKNTMSINYYEDTALKHAALLISQSNKAFQAGELEYITHLFNLRQALTIREGYLTARFELNENKITILLLTGN